MGRLPEEHEDLKNLKMKLLLRRLSNIKKSLLKPVGLGLVTTGLACTLLVQQAYANPFVTQTRLQDTEKEQIHTKKEQKSIAEEQAERGLGIEDSNSLSEMVVSSAATVDNTVSSGINALTPQSESSSFTVPAPTMKEFEDDDKSISQNDPDFADAAAVEDKSFLIGKISGAIAVVVGGKFLIDRRSQQNSLEEAERERQFKLLMGIKDGDQPPITELSDEISDAVDTKVGVDNRKNDVMDLINGDKKLDSEAQLKKKSPSPVEETISSNKRRRLGITSMFSKKKNNRETELNNLLNADATAPEVAKLLSKLLTYGAPGRFPQVNALSGDMLFEEGFEQDMAKELLEVAAKEACLSREEGAELFANVVNCMLIDIIDLSSSSLQEKSDLTYDAINIVINFMNHAASLYDAVAEGVEITSVTYSGTLPKSKLEAMYGTYVFACMTKMPDDMSDRIEMLRDVFSIAEKKSEGVIMKTVQKSMMEMMKTEEGRENIQEMTSKMTGGMEGTEALAGMGDMFGGGGGGGGGGGEEPDMEQVKEMLRMLKKMKDDGNIGPKEFATVRDEFKNMVGSNIEDILKEAESGADGDIPPEDKELFDLVKSLFED